MYTAAALKAYTLKDLAQMAKKRGIRGWHAMRKEELIRALLRAHSPQRKSTTRSKAQPSAGRKKAASARSTSRTPAKKKPTAGRTRAVRRIRQVHADRDRQRDLAGEPKAAGRNGHAANGKAQRDRIVLMVRDPYWLHAHWELTRGSVQRAQAALAEHWHTAKPFLRLVEVEGGHTTSTAESSARFIPIHGGVCHWYIDVPDPPKNYRVEVGYRAASGKFYSLARSNQVTTPRPGDADIDENWSSVEEDYERIYALSGGYSADTDNGDLQEWFGERLRRRPGPPRANRIGVGAEGMLVLSTGWGSG